MCACACACACTCVCVCVCCGCSLTADILVSLPLPTGWEYAIEAGLGNWVPYERTGYLFRRRRWVRTRVKDKDEVFKRGTGKREKALYNSCIELSTAADMITKYV